MYLIYNVTRHALQIHAYTLLQQKCILLHMLIFDAAKASPIKCKTDTKNTHALHWNTPYESISAFMMSALSVGSTIIVDDGAVKPNFFMDAFFT